MQDQKESQMRYLSQSVRLEEYGIPKFVRLTCLSVSLVILGFIGWASFVRIHEVARSPGEIAPQGMAQVIQHAEGGLIRAIYVADGDLVEQGDLLLSLEPSGVSEDLERATSRQRSLNMQRERLRAFIDGRNPDFSAYQNEALISDQQAIFETMLAARQKEENIIRDQISQKEQNIILLEGRRQTADKSLALMRDVYERRRKLHQDGYVSHIAFLESEQRLNTVQGDYEQVKNQIVQSHMAINEFEARLASLNAKHRDEAYEKLDILEAEIADNREVISKLRTRHERLDIRAPVRGLVQGLSVNTIGGVILPGQNLLEILPLDRPLVAEVRISPHHIGHVRPGQDVQIKFSSFDFSRYGSMQGRLEYLSPSTFTGQGGERYYRGRIALDQGHIGDDPAGNIVMPGMTVMADIITGHKTVLEHLLKPVRISFATAMTER